MGEGKGFYREFLSFRRISRVSLRSRTATVLARMRFRRSLYFNRLCSSAFMSSQITRRRHHHVKIFQLMARHRTDLFCPSCPRRRSRTGRSGIRTCPPPAGSAAAISAPGPLVGTGGNRARWRQIRQSSTVPGKERVSSPEGTRTVGQPSS